ncbi:MAG: dephospho-CoA kinase [Anaerolineaceae bacterium]|nr:dephospho-CoA kinase [Anaerolineaceae bacterium]
MVIGVTGGIASGKSEVCRILERMGFLHIDADDVAHTILENPAVISRIAEVFGTDVLYTNDGDQSLHVDRKKLGKIVFTDPQKMDILESITHPQIIKQITGMIKENKEKDIVIEAIEIIKSGIIDYCDKLWVVHVEREQQLERLVNNRHLTYDEALTRLKTQEEHDWDENLADKVIYSTEPIESMEKQVLDALNAH